MPYVRGRERSRSLDDIVREVEGLVADGVLEITLLGQNVNSYGRDLYGEPRFAEVLRAVARTGIRRIRFATSHPKDLSEDTITAMAEEPAVMPYLHLPVQSGSNAILGRMNRVYTRESYLALVDRLYEAIPDLALSTDIIVGFPGETEADFEDTLDVVRRARFDQAFTFIYSPREGTPAAAMEPAIPREVTQERFDRLVELVHRSALAKSRALVGTVQAGAVRGRRASGTRTCSRVERPATESSTSPSRREHRRATTPGVFAPSQSTQRRPGSSPARWVPTSRDALHAERAWHRPTKGVAMSSPVFGIIAPHPPIMVRGVGGSRTETTRESLDALARAAEALSAFDPQTVVVMSPHAPALADAFAVDDSTGVRRFAGTVR